MLFSSILPTTLRILLTAYLTPATSAQSARFTLRHAHGLAANSSRAVFSDVEPSSHFAAAHEFEIATTAMRIPRARSQNDFFAARSLGRAQHKLDWDDTEVTGPDVRQRETLLMLANMTNNAYYDDRTTKGWYELGPEWNTSYPFGWEPDADGFRGHVFANEDNSTVIVALKGTNTRFMGGPTVPKDKLNDNLLFSCCCARVGPTWSTVCGCYEGSYKCDQNCLENSLMEDSLFYSVGINLYNNITYMYPNANIWLTGHSLGGSLSSLIGVTFGVPVVAFEAPGERLAASRLHLPSPPSLQHITHVYHTADPIPQGKCTGISSACSLGGYALETGCHLGKTILYDTVSKLGWAVDARTHGIAVIVEKLLSSDWIGGVPEPVAETDCVDCYAWEFGDFRNSSVQTCQSDKDVFRHGLVIQADRY